MKPKVPNTSVEHAKEEKEQINRATAIHTDFTIAGERKSAEDLGLHTNLENAQEVTKEKSKFLHANLHTDLLNKEEREKLVKAKEKLKTVLDAFQNKEEISAVEYYKAGLRAIHVEELRKEKAKEFALLEDKDLSTLEKLAILRDLQAELYKKEGYEGTLSGLYVTDEANSFAVDGKDGKGKRIFISVQDLESGKGLASLYAHENVHLYSGYENGEHLASYGEGKVSKESSKESFTEEERRAYLAKVKGRVDKEESLEKQFAMAKRVSEENRENFGTELFTAEAYAFGGRVSSTQSVYTLFNSKKEQITSYSQLSTSVGFGSLDIGTSFGIGIYYDDTIEELSKLKISFGGSITYGKFAIGGDILKRPVVNSSNYLEWFVNQVTSYRGIRMYVGKGIENPLPGEIHTTFIEIGAPKNIKESQNDYKFYKKFMKESRERGGEW